MHDKISHVVFKTFLFGDGIYYFLQNIIISWFDGDYSFSIIKTTKIKHTNMDSSIKIYIEKNEIAANLQSCFTSLS